VGSVSRLQTYEGNLYNTEEKTFLLPVSWKDGWPVILEQGKSIPYIGTKPQLKNKLDVTIPLNGNFTIRDEFDYANLRAIGVFIRTPYQKWYSLQDTPGSLSIQLRPDSIEAKNKSFIYRAAATTP
jgi:alpha-N-arabinofuranosidase